MELFREPGERRRDDGTNHINPRTGAMKLPHKIDVDFNFCDDTPEGRDTDQWSPTLRLYNTLLWSKPLPNGALFSLEASDTDGYLRHESRIGKFVLSGDSAIPSFWNEPSLADVIARLEDEEFDRFERLRSTIGSKVVFPSNRINRQMTINGQRGCHPRIKDRFDLTLECIRRYYAGTTSPLTKVFQRYDAFFRLFTSFEGYVDFFLLQDMVSSDYREVRCAKPFNDFEGSPIPTTLEAYRSYRDRMSAFIVARNERIHSYWNKKERRSKTGTTR